MEGTPYCGKVPVISSSLMKPASSDTFRAVRHSTSGVPGLAKLLGRDQAFFYQYFGLTGTTSEENSRGMQTPGISKVTDRLAPNVPFSRVVLKKGNTRAYLYLWYRWIRYRTKTLP